MLTKGTLGPAGKFCGPKYAHSYLLLFHLSKQTKQKTFSSDIDFN